MVHKALSDKTYLLLGLLIIMPNSEPAEPGLGQILSPNSKPGFGPVPANSEPELRTPGKNTLLDQPGH